MRHILWLRAFGCRHCGMHSPVRVSRDFAVGLHKSTQRLQKMARQYIPYWKDIVARDPHGPIDLDYPSRPPKNNEVLAIVALTDASGINADTRDAYKLDYADVNLFTREVFQKPADFKEVAATLQHEEHGIGIAFARQHCIVIAEHKDYSGRKNAYCVGCAAAFKYLHEPHLANVVSKQVRQGCTHQERAESFRSATDKTPPFFAPVLHKILYPRVYNDFYKMKAIVPPQDTASQTEQMPRLHSAHEMELALQYLQKINTELEADRSDLQMKNNALNKVNHDNKEQIEKLKTEIEVLKKENSNLRDEVIPPLTTMFKQFIAPKVSEFFQSMVRQIDFYLSYVKLIADQKLENCEKLAPLQYLITPFETVKHAITKTLGQNDAKLFTEMQMLR